MNYFRTTLLFAFLSLFFVSCKRDEDTLVIGMELTYPPFEMTDVTGKPDGISVRLAESLSKHLNRPIRIEDMRFEGLIPALKTGKIDMILSSMTITDERSQTIDFTDGYVTNALCMLVSKNSLIKSIDDIKRPGVRVAVKLGTTGQFYAQEELPLAEIIILKDAAPCVAEVIDGRADVFIYDQISVFQHWKNHEETTRAILTPIREETWGIGLRPEDDQLKADINGFLKAFQEEKGFEKLADRYMPEEKKAFEEAGVPFIFH